MSYADRVPDRARREIEQLDLLGPAEAAETVEAAPVAEPDDDLATIFGSAGDSPFYSEMTLAAARELIATLVRDGVVCPACDQYARVYRRKVNSSMARGLILIYRRAGTRFSYLQDIRRDATGQADNREESKLRYWSLLEEETARRPDGGRAGWWRVTDTGERWVLGETSIPKYALIYDSRCLGHEGGLVSIHDALGDRFDYRELMLS